MVKWGIQAISSHWVSTEYPFHINYKEKESDINFTYWESSLCQFMYFELFNLHNKSRGIYSWPLFLNKSIEDQFIKIKVSFQLKSGNPLRDDINKKPVIDDWIFLCYCEHSMFLVDLSQPPFPYIIRTPCNKQSRCQLYACLHEYLWNKWWHCKCTSLCTRCYSQQRVIEALPVSIRVCQSKGLFSNIQA